MNQNFLKVEDYFDLLKKFDNICNRLDKIEKLLTSKHEEPSQKKEWLDVQEVCLLLNVSKRTLQSYRDNGMISFSKFGGKVFFKASDIQKTLNTNYRS